jgi:hypothetical protein
MCLPLVIQGVSKRTLQWYSKCCCVASVTKMFTRKVCKLAVVQHLERWIVCTPLSINFFSQHSNIWNTIVKLFSKHPILWLWSEETSQTNMARSLLLRHLVPSYLSLIMTCNWWAGCLCAPVQPFLLFSAHMRHTGRILRPGFCTAHEKYGAK